MIIKKKQIVATLCLMAMAAHAQQNLSWGQGPQVASPVVNPDNSLCSAKLHDDGLHLQRTYGLQDIQPFQGQDEACDCHLSLDERQAH